MGGWIGFELAIGVSLPLGRAQDSEPKYHVEYKVVVHQGSRSWTLLRRYQVTILLPIVYNLYKFRILACIGWN